MIYNTIVKPILAIDIIIIRCQTKFYCKFFQNSYIHVTLLQNWLSLEDITYERINYWKNSILVLITFCRKNFFFKFFF